jgi:hypothetical protein
MKMGTTIKDTIDVNKTTVADSKVKATNQDLNMTAPIVDHLKNDR